MQLQPVQLLGHAIVASRQEAGAHPERLVAEPEIEAGRLDLVVIERRRRRRARRPSKSAPISRSARIPEATHSAPMTARHLASPRLTQAGRRSKGTLSRGDLAGRLAATLNKSLKDRRLGRLDATFRGRFFCIWG